MKVRNCLLCKIPMNQFDDVHQCPKCKYWVRESVASEMDAYENIRKSKEWEIYFGVSNKDVEE